jgi:hypothetical protein
MSASVEGSGTTKGAYVATNWKAADELGAPSNTYEVVTGSPFAAVPIISTGVSLLRTPNPSELPGVRGRTVVVRRIALLPFVSAEVQPVEDSPLSGERLVILFPEPRQTRTNRYP